MIGNASPSKPWPRHSNGMSSIIPSSASSGSWRGQLPRLLRLTRHTRRSRRRRPGALLGGAALAADPVRALAGQGSCNRNHRPPHATESGRARRARKVGAVRAFLLRPGSKHGSPNQMSLDFLPQWADRHGLARQLQDSSLTAHRQLAPPRPQGSGRQRGNGWHIPDGPGRADDAFPQPASQTSWAGCQDSEAAGKRSTRRRQSTGFLSRCGRPGFS